MQKYQSEISPWHLYGGHYEIKKFLTKKSDSSLVSLMEIIPRLEITKFISNY